MENYNSSKITTGAKWTVCYAHSPITFELIQAWITVNNIDKSRIILITYRLDAPSTLLVSKKIKLRESGTSNGVLSRYWSGYGLTKKIQHITQNNSFVLIAPHLLDLELRWLAKSSLCKQIELIEEGGLSYLPLAASVSARGLSHRLLDMIRSPIGKSLITKVFKTWGVNDCTFPGSKNHQRLNMSTIDFNHDFEVCVIVDIIRSDDYDHETASLFRDWCTSWIRTRGLQKIGLRFHPDYFNSHEKKIEEFNRWKVVLADEIISEIEEPLDFIDGQGKFMLGMYSSLLIYASSNNWIVCQPDSGALNTSDVQQCRKIIDMIKEKATL
jgi:hypothetical protein